MRARPHPATCCCILMKKIVSTPSGDQFCGWGTGFHYRDSTNQVWLVTNWHVVTGRIPSDPGCIINNRVPRSPYKLEMLYPGPGYAEYLINIELPLYRYDQQPVWLEYKREEGVDLVAIPIHLPEKSIITCINDFASEYMGSMTPGNDVIITGFPIEQSPDMPFPIWKKAMIASEPSFTMFGLPQIMLDVAGFPGMSGSPVYIAQDGFTVTKNIYNKLHNFEFGMDGALDLINLIPTNKMKPAISLSFAGIYAGSTGKETLGNLSLGRMFHRSFLELLILERKPGLNPYPPFEE